MPAGLSSTPTMFCATAMQPLSSQAPLKPCYETGAVNLYRASTNYRLG